MKKCEFTGCKEKATHNLLMADWGKGKRWIAGVCAVHYYHAESSRRLPENFDIKKCQSLGDGATLQDIINCVF